MVGRGARNRGWRSGNDATRRQRGHWRIDLQKRRCIYKISTSRVSFTKYRLHLARGDGEASSASHVHVLQTWHLAPVRRRVGHEQLIEGAKAARQTRRQADQPQQLPLVTTELADNRQEIVEIEIGLRDISRGAAAKLALLTITTYILPLLFLINFYV